MTGFFNRKAVASFSPGLTLRLPWEAKENNHQPQRGCVKASEKPAKDATALRLQIYGSPFPG
jgi:hypothetical protein